MASRHRTARRVAAGVLWSMAAAHVLEALALRRRREGIGVLAAPDGSHETGKVAVVSVAGGAVDDATRAAARQEMDLRGYEVLDLVPADLPAERWLRLLRRVDPAVLGQNAMRSPGGANEAVALHPALADRMDLTEDGGVEPGAMARLIVRAQRYAPLAHGLRIAPGVKAAPVTPEQRWRELEALTAFAEPYGKVAPLIVTLEALHLLAMTAGALVSPPAALAALATWCAQPTLTLGSVDEDGTPTLSPADLAGAGLLRLPRAWAINLQVMAAGYEATKARAAERAATPLPPVPDLDVRFEPRRETCPWCGSGSLAGKVDLTDLLLHKPGTFHLDECTACGHIFQNPALTPAGLDYYYADTYEGVGEEFAEISFASLGRNYDSRVASLARFAEPKALLDVGTGHAHFMLTARQKWPDAVLDGLDLSDSVEEAYRRGRIDTAYRGLFPEMAGSMPRSYDAVTMHHYLEHTKDPRAELEAVGKVLEHGGHLMIEMPDASHPLTETLGRFWWQWAQPQHQHFIPIPNLVTALEEAGYEVLSVERGPVTLGGDLFNAVALFLQEKVRSPHLPWLPEPGLGHRVKRIAYFVAALPALAATKVIDAVRDANLENDTPSNTYRVVARRR